MTATVSGVAFNLAFNALHKHRHDHAPVRTVRMALEL